MDQNAQKIACIGWGSLVWDQRDLPVVGDWRNDGPMLPIEFARESGGRRLTLVICEGVQPVQTCWCLLDVPDLSSAVRRLANREKISKRIDTDVGRWNLATGESYGMGGAVIASWAQVHNLGGAVWTNLPCGFKDARNVMPSGLDVVAHLKRLEGVERKDAEEYVVKAAPQIDTTYRRLIADELGWT